MITGANMIIEDTLCEYRWGGFQDFVCRWTNGRKRFKFLFFYLNSFSKIAYFFVSKQCCKCINRNVGYIFSKACLAPCWIYEPNFQFHSCNLIKWIRSYFFVCNDSTCAAGKRKALYQADRQNIAPKHFLTLLKPSPQGAALSCLAMCVFLFQEFLSPVSWHTFLLCKVVNMWIIYGNFSISACCSSCIINYSKTDWLYVVNQSYGVEYRFMLWKHIFHSFRFVKLTVPVRGIVVVWRAMEGPPVVEKNGW
jgi:hypothetical protein